MTAKNISIYLQIIFITIVYSCTSAHSETVFPPSSSEPATSLRCNQFTFDATNSYDPDNKSLTFLWDLGDGATSTEPVVNHTYERSGEYKVSLTVTDNSGLKCRSAVTTQNVKVNIPPFASLVSDDLVCVNQPITFDGSGSYTPNGKNLNFSWDLGDGTKSDGKDKVTKYYTKGGQYKVALTVDDGSDAVCTNQTIDKIITVNEPPIAEIGQDVLLKCVTDDNDMSVNFDATKSKDINNDTLTYLWDFGDGTKGDGAVSNHTYADLGNYDVKLIVKDSTKLGCGTGVDFVTVRLTKAPKADAGPDIAICPGENVDFDGSNSSVATKGTASYSWMFGDGKSASGIKSSHVYEKPGKYQASLTVDNQLNVMCPPSTDTRTVIVNSPPSVTLHSTQAVCLGTKVDFDASNAADPDGDNLEYYWSFGDGAILRGGSKVSHEYKQGGLYRVSVIVDDGLSSNCSTATSSTTIKVNTPPIADAGTNTTCCVGRGAEFNGSSSSDPDGDALSYTWEFGDGTSAKGMQVNHAYEKSGNYNVTLTVDDNSGTSCSSSKTGYTAEINSTPVPVIQVR